METLPGKKLKQKVQVVEQLPSNLPCTVFIKNMVIIDLSSLLFFFPDGLIYNTQYITSENWLLSFSIISLKCIDTIAYITTFVSLILVSLLFHCIDEAVYL